MTCKHEVELSSAQLAPFRETSPNLIVDVRCGKCGRSAGILVEVNKEELDFGEEPSDRYKVTIQRSKWLRGPGSQTVDGHGNACAIGHVLMQLGVPTELMPRSLGDEIPREMRSFLPPKVVRRLHQKSKDNRDDGRTYLAAAIHYNDMHLTHPIAVKCREPVLRALLEEAGVDVTFTGEG